MAWILTSVIVPKLNDVGAAAGLEQGVVATAVIFKLSILILGREPVGVIPPVALK